MNFLIDENLPRRLATWLIARGHDATHVLDAGLGGAKDGVLVTETVRSGRTIVTRDADFDRLAAQAGIRIVRLTIGNCSTLALFTWLDGRWSAVEQHLATGAEPVILVA